MLLTVCLIPLWVTYCFQILAINSINSNNLFLPELIMFQFLLVKKTRDHSDTSKDTESLLPAK